MRTIPILVTVAFVTVAFVLLLTGCGGSGGSSQGSASPTVSVLTLYYPGGEKKAEGLGYLAQDNNVVRHGAWTDWFDTGVVSMTGTYVHGTRSASDPWAEYNPDRSVRFDWTDY